VQLKLLDVAVIVVYAMLVLAMSQFLQRGKRISPDEDQDATPARRALPWWAIGTSLIAANISAEQIIGMSGSAYAFGLAIASYEWLAALALIVVGKFFLPVFLKNQITTMPEFLKRRYGSKTQVTLAMFWIGLYTFVALTAIMWLGATAVSAVTGLSLLMSLILLALVAGNYALYVGLRPAAFTDVLQVAMLVVGGVVICFFALNRISADWGGGGGLQGLYFGFHTLTTQLPGHFHMILSPDNPYYKYMPGITVLVGGMWIVHFAYWGFNQYIVQGALAAKSIRDVQKGVVLAAFLKLLMPLLVVLPGIAAALLLPELGRSDEAYPQLMLKILPQGVLGFVFVALVAAIIASMGSTLSSIATIFTVDVFKVIHKGPSKRLLVIVGRFAAIVALLVAMVTAMPLLGNFDQAFQYIQEFNGFFTPGITVVFILGLFWKRATETGALVAAVGSVTLSTFYRVFLPQIPFMNRMGYVFLICLALAVTVSLSEKSKPQTSTIEVSGINFSTGAAYNIAAFVIIAILAALYAVAW
jgi:solute:Na+ symporter, SSS family